MPATCPASGVKYNADAKYQEIAGTEKPHFPEGERSVQDMVGGRGLPGREWRDQGTGGILCLSAVRI